MGILKDSLKKVQALKGKKNMVIDRLVQLGVTHNQDGVPLGSVPYEELKYMLVLAEIRKIDIDHPDHVWFR